MHLCQQRSGVQIISSGAQICLSFSYVPYQLLERRLSIFYSELSMVLGALAASHDDVDREGPGRRQ